MSDAIDKLVDPLLRDLDAAAGSGYSAVLYGSAARGDFVVGRSDLNLMVVADGLDPTTLRRLSIAFKTWQKAGNPPPLVMSRDEWSRATDVFPLEITDMQAAYRLLRGPDPVAGLQVDPADLRRALEGELRGKLLRLRQGYIAATGDTLALGELARVSAPTVLVLFRALLALVHREIPRDPIETVHAAAEVAGFDPRPAAEIVRHRGDRRWRCEASLFEDYLATVERAVGFIDQFHSGA